MKRTSQLIAITMLALGLGALSARVFDHHCVSITPIPASAILQAKNTLHIAYTHTSHGSQITGGMSGLDVFMGGTGLYAWHDGPLAGYLDIDDCASGSTDLGHNGDLGWYYSTQNYLNNPANADVNVVMWSWCGGVSDNSSSGIQAYLNAMNQLETDYPNVRFVYMTGHLDTWSDANLKARNQQIRDYCLANDKTLFDFADIESYDPEGVFYQYTNDNCDYYAGPYGSNWRGNWATAWQNAHPGEWYPCGAAHTEPVNANMKAYAAWWMWAMIAGWDAEVTSDHFALQSTAARSYLSVGVDLQFTETGNSQPTKLTFAKINESPGISGSLPPDIAQVNDLSYWTLHSTRGNVGNFNLTLDLSGVVSEGDFPGVCVLHRPSDNSAWTDISSQISSRTYPNVLLSDLSPFGDFAIASAATLAIPVLQSTTVAGEILTLTWQEVTGATSYLIESAETPYGSFAPENSGSFSGTSWTGSTAYSKRFYRVRAQN